MNINDILKKEFNLRDEQINNTIMQGSEASVPTSGAS